MYVPAHFVENRTEVLQALIKRHPLGTLVATTAEGLTANHIPMQATLEPGGRGLLRGHIARANSLWRELAADAPVLAIFTGADRYVSPTWYPSKQEHGKAVPTWNYATVHLKGTIRFIEEAPWLREFVTELTEVYEQGRPNRWHVSDAPADYIEAMLRAIVGFEIQVSSIQGKFKGSQNRAIGDREGVRSALKSEIGPPTELTEVITDPNSPPT
jgi:transcriptional regulator